MKLRKIWVRLTFGVVLFGCVAEVHAWQQDGRRRVDCSQPKVLRQPAEESSPGDPEPEGTFVPGPANGSVRSGSTTLAVNPGMIRFPSLTLGLPSFQLPSISRVRREAAMLVDEQEAPFIRGRVADVNATLTRPGEPESTPERPAAPNPNPNPNPESDAGDGPPDDPGYRNTPHCYPPCVPPTRREGCVNQDDGTGAEQVARLEAQMQMLQRAVAQLVEVQTASAANQRVPSASASTRDADAVSVRAVGRSQEREVDTIERDERPNSTARPVRQISAEAEAASDTSAEAKLLRQQAAQIEELQRQLEVLKRAHTAKSTPASKASAALAGLVQRQPDASENTGRAKLANEVPEKTSSNPFSSLFGGLGRKR